MELKNLVTVRRLAVFAVAANVVGLMIAAVALPGELKVVLPVLALIAPLLTTAALEGAAERRLGRGALAA